MEVKIRWMVNADLPAVLEIERRCYPNPWSEKAFRLAKAKNENSILVAWADERIVGYMVYEVTKDKMHVLNIAVDIQYQRQGVGRQLVARLIDRICRRSRYGELTALARDNNLGAHLFFQAMGFKAIRVVHGAYKDSDDDAYFFEYNLLNQVEA